jgi:XapX domain-containing protein
MMKSLLGLILAFAIGFACRAFEIPSPAPPVILGALLVVAMTTGYLLVDRLMIRPAQHAIDCGGRELIFRTPGPRWRFPAGRLVRPARTLFPSAHPMPLRRCGELTAFQPVRRTVMLQRTARPKLSEKGPLTPDNCVVAIIDLQPQMLFGVTNFDRQSIINSNLVLSKAARVFDVPVVLSTVDTKGFSGYMWPQIQAVFRERAPIERSSMNAWDDENFVGAIRKSGRKKIVLSGLWTETCVALPTVQAIHDGYEV